MGQHEFRDFGELYRAAFAERDEERKLILLSAVRKAIDEWEEMLRNWVSASPEASIPEKKPRPVPPPSGTFTQAA